MLDGKELAEWITVALTSESMPSEELRQSILNNWEKISIAIVNYFTTQELMDLHRLVDYAQTNPNPEKFSIFPPDVKNYAKIRFKDLPLSIPDGSISEDSSTNGNDITLHGGVSRINNGVSGYALGFNGSTGYATGVLQSFQDTISISFWEKFGAFSSTTKRIFESESNPVSNSGGIKITINDDSTPGRLSFIINTETNIFGGYYDYLVSEELYHIGLTYDRRIQSDDAFLLYINGEKVNPVFNHPFSSLPYSSVTTLPLVYNGNYYLHSSLGSSLFADGWIDGFRLDFSALTPTNLKALYSLPVIGGEDFDSGTIDGEDAVVYRLSSSTSNVMYRADGTFSPASVVYSSTKITGSSPPVAANAIFKIYRNGVLVETSAITTTHTYPSSGLIPFETTLIRAELWDSSDTFLLDYQEINVSTATNTTWTLTNESVSFPADTFGNVVGGLSPGNGSFIIYNGGVEITSGVTYGHTDFQCTVNIDSSGNYSVTSFPNTYSVGYSTLSATFTIPGEASPITVEKVFSLSKGIQGSAGTYPSDENLIGRYSFDSLSEFSYPTLTNVADPGDSGYSWIGITFSSGTATKTASSAWGNASLRSNSSLGVGAKVSFRNAQTNKRTIMGLSSDPTASDSYETIEYALLASAAGNVLAVYEMGTAVSGAVNTYTTTDDLSVVYDGLYIHYQKNGIDFWTTYAGPGKQFFLDAAWYETGTVANAIAFSVSSVMHFQDAFVTADGWGGNGVSTISLPTPGRIRSTLDTGATAYFIKGIPAISPKSIVVKVSSNVACTILLRGTVNGTPNVNLGQVNVIPGQDSYLYAVGGTTITQLYIINSTVLGVGNWIEMDWIYAGDGSYSSLVADDSGRGSPMLLRGGLSRVPGKYGYALRTDGITGYAYGYLSGLTDKITVSFWENFAAFSATQKEFWSSSKDPTNTTGAVRFLGQLVGGSNRLYLRVKTATSNIGGYYDLSSTGFYHLSIVYDRTITSNDAIKLFVGGVQVTLIYDFPYSGAGTLPILYNGDFYVHSRAGTSLFADGDMDDLRIDNSILTLDNIKALNTQPPSSSQAITTQVATLKSLAFEDLVESAKLGETIIDGGYIKTELVGVNYLISGMAPDAPGLIEWLEFNYTVPSTGSTKWSQIPLAKIPTNIPFELTGFTFPITTVYDSTLKRGSLPIALNKTIKVPNSNTDVGSTFNPNTMNASVMLWVKATSVSVSQVIISFGTNNTTTALQAGINGATGHWRLAVGSSLMTSAGVSATGGSPTEILAIADTWTHLALVVNTTANPVTKYVSLYVNGVFAHKKAISSFTAGALQLGGFSGLFFSGSIAGVTIFKKALTTSEINANALSYSGGKTILAGDQISTGQIKSAQYETYDNTVFGKSKTLLDLDGGLIQENISNGNASTETIIKIGNDGGVGKFDISYGGDSVFYMDPSTGVLDINARVTLTNDSPAKVYIDQADTTVGLNAATDAQVKADAAQAAANIYADSLVGIAPPQDSLVLALTGEDVPPYPDGAADQMLKTFSATPAGWTANGTSAVDFVGGSWNISPDDAYWGYQYPVIASTKMIAILVRVDAGVGYFGFAGAARNYPAGGTYLVSERSDGATPFLLYGTDATASFSVLAIYIGDGALVSKVIDSSKSNLRLDNKAVLPVPGAVGTALFFNAMSYLKIISDKFDRVNGQALNLACIIRPRRVTGNIQIIVNTTKSGVGTNWFLYLSDTDGHLSLGGAALYESTWSPPVDEDTHVTATVSPAGQCVIMANGAVIYDSGVGGFGFGGATGELWIGQDAGSPSNFDGTIARLLIDTGTVWTDANKQWLYTNRNNLANLSAINTRGAVSADLGYNSFEDLSSAASAGRTIIDGGMIRTNLINADFITSGMTTDSPGLIDWYEFSGYTVAGWSRRPGGGSPEIAKPTDPSVTAGTISSVPSTVNPNYDSTMKRNVLALTAAQTLTTAIDSAASMNPTTASRTAMLWVNITATGTSRIMLSWGATAGTNQALTIGTTTGNVWGMGIQSSLHTTSPSAISVTSNWTHLAIVLNSELDTAYLYVNGVLAVTKAYTSFTNVGVLNVNGFSGSLFSGSIAGLKVFNRALTQFEVKADSGTTSGGRTIISGDQVSTGSLRSAQWNAYGGAGTAKSHLDLDGAVTRLYSRNSSNNGDTVVEQGRKGFAIVSYADASVVATAMVAGNWYQILTVGTTVFTSYGALFGSVGETFIATGAGTGTGTVKLGTVNFTADNDGNISIVGGIRGGGRYGADGSTIDATKPGFFLGATGSCKVAGLTFEGSQGGGGQWSSIQKGGGLSISGIGNPALATLTRSMIVFADSTLDSLRHYYYSSNSWVLLGSGLTISGMGNPAIGALNSTDIAFIDDALESLRCYRRAGAPTHAWSQVGSGLTISGITDPAICVLNETDIAFIDSSLDSLRCYRFNGSTWSLVGSGLSISGISDPKLTALSETDVALFDGNGNLYVYRFNGSTWSLVGGSSITWLAYASITALNGNEVLFVDPSLDYASVLRFNGSTWDAVASFTIEMGSGVGAITAMSGVSFALIDTVTEELAWYSLGFSVSSPWAYPFTGE